MNVLVTGSNGFIGKNMVTWLGRLPDVRVLGFDQDNTPQELAEALAGADLVYHLAGVNRPDSEDEFRIGNVDLTAQICNRLLALGRATPIVLSSSIQAELDNAYGISKRQAEAVVVRYAETSGARCTIFRLKNVFGKWCRPNYNSVVATFCHNIAHDLPITISDPGRDLELVHVDDVVEAFISEIRRSGIRDQEPGDRSWLQRSLTELQDNAGAAGGTDPVVSGEPPDPTGAGLQRRLHCINSTAPFFPIWHRTISPTI